jgi:predicted enzyme related to lactoylglutathione lyase
VISPQPLITLDDVDAGSRWFCAVLGVTSGHGGSEYEMLMDGDELVAQLHHWDAHEHQHLGERADPSRGNGVLLWFAVDDFDAAMERVTEAAAEILEGPFLNAGARQREVWLRGPDGYVVVIAGPRTEPV